MERLQRESQRHINQIQAVLSYLELQEYACALAAARLAARGAHALDSTITVMAKLSAAA